MRSAARVALVRPLARAIGARRRRGHGAALDPQIAAVLELQRLLRLPPLESMAPPRARAFAEAGLSPLDVALVPMAEVVDITAKRIPIRIYRPRDAGPHWIVYFHGGGGVIGSIRASDPIVRLLAAQTGCTVASVDYRLGPEDKHPAAIDDACAAYAAIAARLAPGARIAVAGDSFGGYLSAQVDRLAARRPDLQVLIYPLVDMTLTKPSIERHADGFLLTRSLMYWFRGHYLNDDDDRHAISPLYWDDLRRAAPAVVVTAGYDPLVDEGDAYAVRLRDAGVPVIHHRHDDLVHGFISLAGAVRAARAAVDTLTSAVRDQLTRAR